MVGVTFPVGMEISTTLVGSASLLDFGITRLPGLRYVRLLRLPTIRLFFSKCNRWLLWLM